MIAPKASSNARISSTGSDAPPETQSRSFDRSALSRPGSWSNAPYIVGTPSNTVTPSRWRISSALAGSNRGRSVRHAPPATAAFIPHVWPKEWNNGSAPSTTSSSQNPNTPRMTSTFVRRLSWVSSAPLGFPVVPRRVQDDRGVVAPAVGDLRHRLGGADHLLGLARLDEDQLCTRLLGARLRGLR